ncbi:MAG: translesion DNA synthesis-associated protein ImuA [Oceanospirillaceae bacterium]|nr:translesion DNA synthesis-associated protein ImuA [Oceanospirillaceae bacterium]
MSLDQLLQQGTIWRGREAANEATVATLSSGHAQLDQWLPGGGWQSGNLVEVLYDTEGCGELRLLLPLLAAAPKDRWIVWVDPPHIPYAPALKAAGVALERLLLVRSTSRRDRLWCLEQALKSGCCAAVLGWVPAGEAKSLRRLQLAASEGGGLGFVFRSTACRDQSSPAPYRLLLEPEQDGAGVGVSVLKRKGGWPLPRQVLPLDELVRGRRSPASGRSRLRLVNGHG